MKVKICGIQNSQDGIAAAEAGADMIGFVFAPSKRRIEPGSAAEIAAQLPDYIKKTGVFVNEDAAVINEIADQVGLDYIQLHGDEAPGFLNVLNRPVIKAFSIKGREDVTKLQDYECAFYLLDSPGEAYRGGSGHTFDWSLVSDLPELKGRIILAGGLKPENVQQAIKETAPFGVDVSSGVETEDKKDHQKINAFITAAKQTERGK